MNIQKCRWFDTSKPFLAVVFLQFGLAGMDILSKAALNQGISNYVLVVYRHIIATAVIAPFAIILDKKLRPKMSLAVCSKIMMLSLLEPVMDQNLYYLGMNYTSATFAAAMSNILPAITFIMAWILKLENIQFKSIRSQAKMVGTLTTVAGAMVMTLIKGPIIELFWTKQRTEHEQQRVQTSLQNTIKGSLMITVGCFCQACFMNLQAITLKAYPAELSLTAWICLFGTVEGTAVALVMERGKTAIWSIGWGTKLLAAVYSGIFCSALAYYIQGVVMKVRGPVFVTAFSPLSMVIVAILSSFILGECLYLGRIMGALVIILGLYLVVWGKSKDQTPIASTDEQMLPAPQAIDADDCRKDRINHESITIEASEGGIITRNEDSIPTGIHVHPDCLTL